MCAHIVYLCMLAHVFACRSVDHNQRQRINNKGHSLSESVYVIVPISVHDFVLTVIVTIVEGADL